MMAKPIKTLELHYPMKEFLIKSDSQSYKLFKIWYIGLSIYSLNRTRYIDCRTRDTTEGIL